MTFNERAKRAGSGGPQPTGRSEADDAADDAAEADE